MEKHWFIGLCQLASRGDPHLGGFSAGRIVSQQEPQRGGSSAGRILSQEDPQLGRSSAGRILSQPVSPIPPLGLGLFVYLFILIGFK